MLADRVLAEVPRHPGRWRPPVLVALMGLPGTGKTAVAGYLAGRLPLAVLATDAIRLRHGLASGPDTHLVMNDVAARLLAEGGGVVWDGIHATRDHRDRVRRLAAAAGARFELLWCTAAIATVRARLDARAADPVATAADGKFVITPEKLAQFVAWLEPPGPDEPHTVVDSTEGPIGAGLAALEERLARIVV